MGDAGQTGADLTQQAIDWLVALDCGTADEDAFDAWRTADPRHAAAFAQVAATWRRTADPRLAAMLDSPLEPLPESPADAPRTWSRRAVAGGAVAAVVGLGGTGAMLAWPRRAYAETAIGERRTIRLPDGSHAMLNTDTRIGWRFAGTRDLWLERGEIALLVGAAAQPFRVYSAPVDARLSAGSFGLRIAADSGQLLVLAGQADATHGTLAATIRAGSMLMLHDGSARVTAVSPDTVVAATAWQNGRIVFDGMPLGAAIAEFNRYLPDKIVLQESDLAATRLGGAFRTDDPANFLLALREGFDIDHRKQGDHILLFRKHD